MFIDPFKDMFKIKAYTKWYHYFWMMPLVSLYFFIFFILPFLVIGLPIRIIDNLQSKRKRK